MSFTSQTQLHTSLQQLKDNLSRVIQGKDEALDILLIALLAKGSVLMEDVPGVGKTTLAKALAQSMTLKFQRVQFTPDLLPADILGSSIYNPVEGNFNFREGPVFCNILLADEINRASPRTQSALLESMSEQQATIEGVRYPLSEPFMVIATQNPVDFHGTYPLPEAQLDRFLLQLNLGYPTIETELDILYSQKNQHPIELIEPVLSMETLREIQRAVKEVQVERSVAHYLLQIVAETRSDPRLQLGVSPRGSLMLFRAAQARACYFQRNHVLPDDIQQLAEVVLSHRIILTSKSKYSNISKAHVIQDILTQLPVPT